MIRRITTSVCALLFVSLSAYADDPGMGGGTIEIQKERAVMHEPAPETPVMAAPPAYVELQSTAIAAGIGARIGAGTLLVEGQEHPFTLKGVSLGDLGASRISAEGPVANLENVSDFAGTYVAVEAGAAAVNGASRITMRNEKGVVITLQADLKGAQLILGGQALSIELQ